MSVMRPLNKQKGVALITALLIAALVTVAAVAMASRQQLDVRRTGNMLEADQAYMYALGMEALVAQVLIEDKKETGEIDALTEIWNAPLPPTLVEGGMVSGNLEDMQGRYNLNNLVYSEGNSEGDNKGKIDQAQIKVFQTILEQVSAASSDEKKIQFSPFVANRVADWIDADLNSSADGAEDLEYLNLDVPYRAANRLMASPSELASILGLKLNEVNALLPLVATLPETTRINVNTAPEIVLMSLHEDITPGIALELKELREEEPFEKTADFVKTLRDDHNIELDDKLIAVDSDYFLVTTNAAIGRTQLRMYSLLNRKGNKITTIRRGFGAY